jgi:hypothetical protein
MTLTSMARAAVHQPREHGAPEARRGRGLRGGSYPSATLQYSSTTLYQTSYHMQSLFCQGENRISPYLRAERRAELPRVPGDDAAGLGDSGVRKKNTATYNNSPYVMARL